MPVSGSGSGGGGSSVYEILEYTGSAWPTPAGGGTKLWIGPITTVGLPPSIAAGDVTLDTAANPAGSTAVEAAGPFTTSSASFVTLSGPTVPVTLNVTGLIVIYLEASLSATAGSANVGISFDNGSTTTQTVLQRASTSAAIIRSRPASTSGVDTTTGAAGEISYWLAAGSYTVRPMFLATGGTATFTNVRMVVSTR